MNGWHDTVQVCAPVEACQLFSEGRARWRSRSAPAAAKPIFDTGFGRLPLTLLVGLLVPLTVVAVGGARAGTPCVWWRITSGPLTTAVSSGVRPHDTGMQVFSMI